MPGTTKPQGELRRSAVVGTFGPGAMTDLPEHSVLVSGLDFWYGPMETIGEPRLAKKIEEVLEKSPIALRTPPAAKDGDEVASSGIPVFRFPEWFITQDTQPQSGGRDNRDGGSETRSRFLVHANALSKGRFRHPDTDKRLSVVPVRFVRACRRGHIGDIDWYFFLHGVVSQIVSWIVEQFFSAAAKEKRAVKRMAIRLCNG